MVYVLNKDGQPLMPTENHAKVRVFLKNRKAKVVKRCPFTVQLLYDTTDYTQPVSLGVDAGSKHIGLSAVTDNKVLFESETELRNDIVKPTAGNSVEAAEPAKPGTANHVSIIEGARMDG